MNLGAVLALVAAVIVAFVLQGGGSSGGGTGGKSKGEIFLETTSASGTDPFTPSTASHPEKADEAVEPVAPPANTTSVVNGAHPGLYGGTKNAASCDVEKQITYLTREPDRGKAFSGVLGIRQPEIPSYLRSLTPVRLGWDTRVTNHGYANKAASSYQATLQAGTAVLIDSRGVPRVRCASGNPLTPPVTVKGTKTYTGQKWAAFRPAALVVVKPAEKPMKTVTLFDRERKEWLARPSGDQSAGEDREIPTPKGQPPGESPPVLKDEQSPEEQHKEQPGKTPETSETPDTPGTHEPPEQKPEEQPKDNPELNPEQQKEPQSPPEQQEEPQSPEPQSPEPQSPEPQAPEPKSPEEQQEQPQEPQQQPQQPKHEDQLPQLPQLPRLPYYPPGSSEQPQSLPF
ncbi:DUF6777 domain-containing protein [Streptomyces sp. NPDC059828]|uniref:DUF6777 domain-containing protein n=1 Tax=Streptomyces sp. NPDC059828 TaxID=3346965 RepID=UPI003653AE43